MVGSHDQVPFPKTFIGNGIVYHIKLTEGFKDAMYPAI